MKITKTIITTIEIEEAEKKLLAIEYENLSVIMKRMVKADKQQDKFDTIHELMQNLLN